MPELINQNERVVLRDLAKKQLEYSKSPQMQELTKLWYDHNDLKGKRPMFTIEMNTFKHEIPIECKCTSEIARGLEYTFYSILENYEYIGDDSVIPPLFQVKIDNWFKPFDIGVETKYAQNSLGHQFQYKINDLKDDFSLLKKSTYGTYGIEKAEQYKSLIEDVFGDILPVEFVGDGLYSVPTQDIVHIMSMENMLLSMYDYPELFHEIMKRLTDDYVEYFKWLEKGKLLLPTNSYGRAMQGTYCFTNLLPSEGEIKTNDVWGFLDSQETIGISPDMFEEFIFPYYKKIADIYGLLSYGCCEPVDPIYDSCLSKLKNLRKLSISPWCNEEFMGERLRNSNTIYHRKPSPNYLGVGFEFDEVAWREHIRKTLNAANGCKIEITQRDVYTLSGNLQKLKRATQIVHEEIQNNWV
jgi:hypothetical protein